MSSSPKGWARRLTVVVPAVSVKITVFLQDLGRFGELNEEMARHFNPPYPARAAVQVSALPRGTDVEIDAILVRR